VLTRERVEIWKRFIRVPYNARKSLDRCGVDTLYAVAGYHG
jgi:hypothetical protein